MSPLTGSRLSSKWEGGAGCLPSLSLSTAAIGWVAQREAPLLARPDLALWNNAIAYRFRERVHEFPRSRRRIVGAYLRLRIGVMH